LLSAARPFSHRLTSQCDAGWWLAAWLLLAGRRGCCRCGLVALAAARRWLRGCILWLLNLNPELENLNPEKARAIISLTRKQQILRASSLREIVFSFFFFTAHESNK
jgi:hypothetical protein